MTDKKENVEEVESVVSDKQARMTEIAMAIFTGRCASNEELKAYLDLFISSDEKQLIRSKEAKEREYRKQVYEKAKAEYEESLKVPLQYEGDNDEDFIFKPLEELMKRERERDRERQDYWGSSGVSTSPYSRRVGYDPSTFDKQKRMEEMMRKIATIKGGYPGVYPGSPIAPKTWPSKNFPMSPPQAPVDGPTYDDQAKGRLAQLAEQMNKEIEMAYFLAKLFVDRRLRVLK
jgi:hypothetical protein